MKKILIGLAILVGILVVASVVVLGKMDGLIADAVKVEGSKALGTSVNVGSIKTAIKEGSISVFDLSIANPEGYADKYALQVKEFSAGVDYGKKEIAEILLSDTVINAELKGSNSNFQDILNGLPESESADEEVEASGEEIVLTIQALKILAAKVNLTTDSVGNHSFVMDDFILRNIKGTPTEIATEVSNKLTNHISGQVSKFSKALLKAEVSKVIEKEKEEAKEKLNKKLDDKLKGTKLEGFKF